jgi:DNA polymerase III subunit delta
VPDTGTLARTTIRMTATLRDGARGFHPRPGIWEVIHVGRVRCATMAGMSTPRPSAARPAGQPAPGRRAAARPAAEPPAPLHLVLGDEELLVERAVRAVVDAARAAEPEVEVRRLRAAEATATDLAAVLSPSLFAEARVIVLEAAHEAGKDASTAVMAQAVEPGDGIVVVVQHAGGARNKALADALRKAGAQVVRCEKLRADERADFVRTEVRRAGGTIVAEALGVLIDAVGTDLRELAAAVAQLVADTGGTVDGEAVRRYHRGRAEATGFAVADKVVAGDRAGALEALRWALVLGTPAVLVADALADGVRTLAKVGAAGRGDPNRLAGLLGMPPWKIRKAQSQVRGWHPEGLAVAVAAAAEANADVKGAAPDTGYALERAVLRMCAAREIRG